MSFDEALEVPDAKSARVDERNRQAQPRPFARDAGADDPAPDDQEVEEPLRELGERAVAAQLHNGFVQATPPSASRSSSRP